MKYIYTNFSWAEGCSSWRVRGFVIRTRMYLYTVITAILVISTTTALPISPKLSADSFSIFEDGSSHYPTISDALHSLCRTLSTEPRAYELDRLYRTKELQTIVSGQLESVCAERLALPKRPSNGGQGKAAKIIYVGTGSPWSKGREKIMKLSWIVVLAANYIFTS